MPNQIAVTPLTLYNLDNTVFDGLQLPDYHFPRSIEYEDLFLTEGWTLDRETLIENILLETAELDTIYTTPDFFKFAVSAWCKKEFPVWKALYETIFYKYNPIWNKDGTIKETAQNVRNLTGSGNRVKANSNVTNNVTSEFIGDTDNTERTKTDSNNNVITKSGNTNTSENDSGNDIENNVGNRTNTGSENKETNKNSVDTEGTGSTSITGVSAFDQMSAFSNKEKTDTSGNKTNVVNENGEEVINKKETETNTDIKNTSHSGSKSGESVNNENTVDINSGNENESNNRTYNRNRNESGNLINNGTESEDNSNNENESNNGSTERIEQGNIGIVTTQQMIQAERDLVKFNIYDFIIDSFKARFCIMVY